MKKLLKKLLPKSLISPLLPAYHLFRAIVANVINGFPARKLNVIGVTGTNGKTTTILYIANILQAAGHKVGYSTSIYLMVGDKIIEEKQNSAAGPGTTRDVFVMQKLMKRMKRAKVDWVVLEVTSHALAQYRTWGIPIHTAVLTNLSSDHLDYHKTMDNYMAAKAKLLSAARHNRIINRDDEHFDYFARKGKAKLLSFGRSKTSDVQLTSSTLATDGATLEIKYDKTIKAKIHLPGAFNVQNALAAAAVGLALDQDAKTIQSGLEALQQIPGRMEQLTTTKGFRVVVDYAHSPDAFNQVFSSLHQVTKGRVIAVFGGHVQHDYKGLGEAAGEGADILIITDDEPEHADPAKIRQTILEAARASDSSGKKQMLEIADRREGMQKAFELAGKDDVVALLCLGHQNYRRIGSKKVPWNDRQEAEKLLKKQKLLK